MNNGKKIKYNRRVRMYKEGYVSVSVYLNVAEDGSKFYDTVIHRKIKNGKGFEWKRGTNYKPKDLEILVKLLREADDFLSSELSSERDSIF